MELDSFKFFFILFYMGDQRNLNLKYWDWAAVDSPVQSGIKLSSDSTSTQNSDSQWSSTWLLVQDEYQTNTALVGGQLLTWVILDHVLNWY